VVVWSNKFTFDKNNDKKNAKKIAEMTEKCNLGFRGYLRIFLSIYNLHSVKTCDYSIVIPVLQEILFNDLRLMLTHTFQTQTFSVEVFF